MKLRFMKNKFRQLYFKITSSISLKLLLHFSMYNVTVTILRHGVNISQLRLTTQLWPGPMS